MPSLLRWSCSSDTLIKASWVLENGCSELLPWTRLSTVLSLPLTARSIAFVSRFSSYRAPMTFSECRSLNFVSSKSISVFLNFDESMDVNFSKSLSLFFNSRNLVSRAFSEFAPVKYNTRTQNNSLIILSLALSTMSFIYEILRSFNIYRTVSSR